MSTTILQQHESVSHTFHLLERNELTAAEASAIAVLDHAQRNHDSNEMTRALTANARVQAALNHPASATVYLDRSRRSALGTSLNAQIQCELICQHAEVFLDLGDLTEAANWKPGLSHHANNDPVAAALLVRLKLSTEATHLAEDVPHVVKGLSATSPLRERVRIGAIAAAAMEHDGRRHDALIILSTTLRLAQEHEYVRGVAEMAPYVSELVDILIDRSNKGHGMVLSPGLIRRLQQALRISASSGEPSDTPSRRSGDGNLSERELQVLKMLPSGLSNRELGSELFLSINTVKSHIKSIYSKLGVSRRESAIERARELGILEMSLD